VIVDYHMHLRDSAGNIDHTADAVERFVEIAQSRGVDEIGFSEHVYYFAQTRRVWWLPYYVERCVYDLDVYVGALVEAKRRGLPVKAGIEVDWTGERAGELAEILAAYPWDYLLGSVHLIGDHAIDNGAGLGVWAEMPADGVWERYADELSAAAASGYFDVLSHPDLPKIYGARGSDETYARLARAADDAGVALEISTGGTRKPVGELYPDARLLQMSSAPVTLASDAHEPESVGHEIGAAVSLARASGRDTVRVFDARSRRQEPLG
jgi:histidinol-phosphatase (PHP family)